MAPRLPYPVDDDEIPCDVEPMEPASTSARSHPAPGSPQRPNRSRRTSSLTATNPTSTSDAPIAEAQRDLVLLAVCGARPRNERDAFLKMAALIAMLRAIDLSILEPTPDGGALVRLPPDALERLRELRGPHSLEMRGR